MLTENSQLILFVMLEVLTHFSGKNHCICHVAPGVSHANCVLFQGEVALHSAVLGTWVCAELPLGYTIRKALMGLPF